MTHGLSISRACGVNACKFGRIVPRCLVPPAANLHQYGFDIKGGQNVSGASIIAERWKILLTFEVTCEFTGGGRLHFYGTPMHVFTFVIRGLKGMILIPDCSDFAVVFEWFIVLSLFEGGIIMYFIRNIQYTDRLNKY